MDEERIWNMKAIDSIDDEYIIHLNGNPEEQSHSLTIEDDDDDIAMLLTNTGCEDLKRFLDQEATAGLKVFCERCEQRECNECDALKQRYSEEDRAIYKEAWEKTKLVQKDGKTRVEVEYIYRNDPNETFAPKNSNFKAAIGRINSLIDSLLRKGQLEEFEKEIEKKIQIGTLKEIPESEHKKLLEMVHHFCYLGVVHSETSESTSTRMINNTLTSSKAGTSFSIENKIPSVEIGDTFTSIMDFMLYRYGYSSDITKCYLKVLVDELTSRLRLMVWYKDAKKD